jgi:hypothetical protein
LGHFEFACAHVAPWFRKASPQRCIDFDARVFLEREHLEPSSLESRDELDGPQPIAAAHLPRLCWLTQEVERSDRVIAVAAMVEAVDRMSGLAVGAGGVAIAADRVRVGEADVMIAGGSEAAITPFAYASFCSMKAMSTRNDDPTRASRPFDAQREPQLAPEARTIESRVPSLSEHNDAC